MKDIYFDRAERNICHDCVDKLQGLGKSETLKNVGDITVYGTYESEEEESEVEGTVIVGGDNEVSVMPVVHPHWTVNVSSLGSFLSVSSSSKYIFILLFFSFS